MSLDSPSATRVDGAPLSFGIVAARYNQSLVDGLLDTVIRELKSAGVKESKIEVLRVPGSNEVPVAAGWLADGGRRHCVVALGVLIKGGTSHHEIVADGAVHALQRVALDTGVPVINGIVVVDNLKQAEIRCVGHLNRGHEFARAALEMAALRRSRKGAK